MPSNSIVLARSTTSLSTRWAIGCLRVAPASQAKCNASDGKTVKPPIAHQGCNSRVARPLVYARFTPSAQRGGHPDGQCTRMADRIDTSYEDTDHGGPTFLRESGLCALPIARGRPRP